MTDRQTDKTDRHTDDRQTFESTRATHARARRVGVIARARLYTYEYRGGKKRACSDIDDASANMNENMR